MLALICVMFGFLHATSQAAVMHTHVNVCLSSCKYSCWTCHAFVHQMMVEGFGLAGAVGATNEGSGLSQSADRVCFVLLQVRHCPGDLAVDLIHCLQ